MFCSEKAFDSTDQSLGAAYNSTEGITRHSVCGMFRYIGWLTWGQCIHLPVPLVVSRLDKKACFLQVPWAGKGV